MLFLDELPEFPRHALEMLREPLETGEVRLARARCSIRYPARFQLVGAMNPCPCGFAGDPRRRCRCGDAQRLRYAGRLSGPLLDRMDLQVRVAREEQTTLFSKDDTESSEAVRERTTRARWRQLRRQDGCNAHLQGAALVEGCKLDDAGRSLLERAGEALCLSHRALQRCLRVSRTIADLESADAVRETHLREALSYRSLFDGTLESTDA